MSDGSRLSLRPLTAAEAERALAGSGELAYVEDYPSTFATEVLRLVAAYPPDDGREGPAEPPLGPWAIVRLTDETVIGTVSCARMDDPSAVTVGYEVAPSCQGQGYATEALGLAVQHLLAQPEVWRVCADTTTDHVASRRVMEKAGLRWLRDEVETLEGREVTLAHYAVDREPPT
jgi:RimJ/RimL family protein N-acetyltransferase